MKAKDKHQYEAAWQHHINELAALALAGDIDYIIYIEVKHELERWLDNALASYIQE